MTARPADDVVVVGGGPAGAIAALVLARRGWRVRVFDRSRFPRPKLCGDTLNPGALAALAAHVDASALQARGAVLRGMRLSGPDGAVVSGAYPPGIRGLAITRVHLDALLLAAAADAGAVVEESVLVRGPQIGSGGVRGVRVATPAGERVHPARVVLAADGRASRLAQAAGLAETPAQPRRWAFGVYAHDVGGLVDGFGEMHVRGGYYLGLAPLADGVANVCLVVPRAAAARAVAAPWRAIVAATRQDPLLRERLAAACPASAPVVLGPMAVDVARPGVPGLLLAGDAAGFVDPMTGDGLRLAIDGALLAAQVGHEVLDGRQDAATAPEALADRRREAFRTKWRFNRALRRVVDHPEAIRAATWAARHWPGAFASMIRYAGDVRRVA